MGQQINQLNDKEKDQRRLSRGEEKSNVNNNSKNFGMVKLQVWALTQFFFTFSFLYQKSLNCLEGLIYLADPSVESILPSNISYHLHP